MAALDIEAAVRRDEGLTVMIMLLNKGAFFELPGWYSQEDANLSL